MKKRISVVIPAYNEEGNIDELGRRLAAVFAENDRYDFEVLLIENGSHDGTYEKMVALHRRDPRFKMVRLSRNFRMDGGITAGLSLATGDAAVMMTAALRDPPELITQFLRKWEEGYENVYQIVTKRHGSSLLRRINSELFYWVLNKMTDGLFPRNVSDFRLVDRRVYQTINGMQERNRFVRGLFVWAGFRSTGIECERPARFSGTSHANTLGVLSLATKGIFAHTYLPLRAITLLGVGLSAFAFVLLALVVYRAFAQGVPFDGFGTIVGIMLLMFGFLFTSLGVMAEYVGLIYEEVKERPNFIVKETLGL